MSTQLIDQKNFIKEYKIQSGNYFIFFKIDKDVWKFSPRLFANRWKINFEENKNKKKEKAVT